MARNGSGAYSLPSGNPVVTGTTISSTWANTTLSDIATALTNSIAKDGQTTPTANLPMGNFKHTSVAVAVATTDYARADQVQNGSLVYLTSVSGADTITATAAISLAAYAAGQKFNFVSAGANTGAVTLNVNGIGAKAVTKNGAAALVAGEIASGAACEVIYDGTQFQLVSLTKIGTSANNLVQLNSSAQLPAVDGSLLTGISFAQIQPISASVAANALTISASSLSLDFRSTTLGNGAVTRVIGTPSNLVISSGSTLGTVSGQQSDIAVLTLNNAGTLELAAVNLSGGVDLSETGLISTTAEGGAGAADSATVIYSTTARTDVAYRVIGIIRSTQATAGTWATAPSLIQGAGGQALASMSSLGYGQTWQTPSRSQATTYYNTTGKPISIHILYKGNSENVFLALTVNGVLLGGSGSPGIDGYCTLFVIIPPGGSYISSTPNGGTVTVSGWAELR